MFLFGLLCLFTGHVILFPILNMGTEIYKRFPLLQTTKKQSCPQSLTELLEWKSNKIWANDPSSHIVCNVKSFEFFILLAAHTVSFHCVTGEEKDLERPPNKKTLRKFLNFIYLGIYEEQSPCGQWTKTTTLTNF